MPAPRQFKRPVRPARRSALTGLAAVAFAPLLGGAEFGVMTHFAQGWNPTLIQAVSAAQIPTVRDELYWKSVEPQPGVYTFPARFETYMAGLAAGGVAPLIELDFENPLYDGGLTPCTDAGRTAYANYASAVLRHYGSQIKTVEIWNEFNGSFCKGPDTQDRAGSYFALLKTAHDRIKRDRPDVIVVGGGTAGIPLPYLEKLFRLGALEHMDALSVHPYRFDRPPEGLELDLQRLNDLVRQYNHGRTMPIWVTEIGWGTKASVAPGDLEITDSRQASFLVRAYALLVSAEVERVYWYLFRDYGPFATMGLVHDDASASPKSSYAAAKVMVRLLGGCTYQGRDRTPADLYSMRFGTSDGRQLRVLWSLSGRKIAPVGATRITDLYGKEINPAQELAVTENPVYIEGPVQGLPAPAPDAPTLLADSTADFSAQQGGSGWSYGCVMGNTAGFIPLSTYRVTDWKREWADRHPHLSITETDQHPSVTGSEKIAAVRRWTSDRTGQVQITARFQTGVRGDGVGVEIRAADRVLFSRTLGGGGATVADFSTTLPVRPGTTLDFSVDPGPDHNIDFDATVVSVRIYQANS